jgi:hypothetical protein
LRSKTEKWCGKGLVILDRAMFIDRLVFDNDNNNNNNIKIIYILVFISFRKCFYASYCLILLAIIVDELIQFVVWYSTFQKRKKGTFSNTTSSASFLSHFVF